MRNIYTFLICMFYASIIHAQTWSPQTSPVASYFSDVYFIDNNLGWSSSFSGDVLKTTNAGVNWTSTSTGTGAALNDIDFCSSTVGWVCGNGGVLLYTNTGGSGWSVENANGSINNWYGVACMSATEACIVGHGGEIKTRVAGNWVTSTAVVNENLLAVDFISTTQGWAVGDSGTILMTTDGGVSWDIQSSGLPQQFLNVHFSSPTHGYAVGQSGLILATTNGGTNWTTITSPYFDYIMNVFFTSDTVGWIATNAGTIFNTTNGGVSWSEQPSGVTGLLEGLYFTSANEGWAVGLDGILHFTNFVGLNEPVEQNNFSIYPNPSSDHISFDWKEIQNIEQIQLLTLEGKLIQTYQSKVSCIDISLLDPGTYYIRIYQNHQFSTSPFIKK